MFKNMESCTSQELLFYIDSNLGQEDVQSLKFLCMDLIPPKKMEKIQSSLDLFDELGRTCSLEENNLFIVSELLYLIGYHRLLPKLNTNREKMKEELREQRNVSFYRRMLFNLSEHVSLDDVKEIIFLLKLPNKSTQNKTFLDILSLLEKNEQLTKDNLDILERLFSKISPDLLIIIYNYKESEIAKESVPAEHDLDDLSKRPLSIQVHSPADKVLPNDEEDAESIREHIQKVNELPIEKGLEAENDMSALSLEDQPASSHSEVDSALESLLVYPMNRKHRGYCLVINNSHFMRSLPREGTEIDAENLKKVFTWLGFKVEVYDEQTAKEISNIMEDFQKRDHTDRDCFVCCILTHGYSGAIFGTDNENVNITTIVSCFTTGKCETLAGKPKLFFIQACQGGKNQNAHEIEPDAVSLTDDEKTTTTIAEDADVLIGMSTVDGYSAYRHRRQGTWYIQALCSNLIRMVPRGEDILSILTQVNKDVSEKEYYKENKLLKQMPQPSYTLRKKLIFPKPSTVFEHQ